MDGLVCGVILKELGLVEDIIFAHPKDMQDGLVDVGPNDITTNLPYVPGVYVAFDHHASELTRLGEITGNHIIDPDAPSAARVVYDYFDGKTELKNISEDMMKAVDKADSAAFTKEDILNPQGWELLSFVMDARTGLGRFRDFNISNYQLMMRLIDFCRTQNDINKILELEDVKERVDLYFEHQEKAKEQIKKCAVIHDKLAVLDLRQEDEIYASNRFMIYALFPDINISMHVMWGRNKQNTVFAVGKSIFDRSSTADIGALMLEYGGGGHHAAGTCQIPNLRADDAKEDLIVKLKTT